MSRSLQPPYLDPLPALSRAEQSVLIQEAYESYEQLFKAIRIARSGQSPHATALGGVSGKTTGTVMMCTTTTITGTLEEVAELYTAPDSHFVLDFAESKRLYELESPSKESPLRCVGVRYSRWASISSLVTDRDLVYLEVMDEFVDKKTGHRGWARCTKSVEHRACPPSQHPSGPLRAELFVMGLVVRETATFGVLELITLVHADVRKRIPSWITRTVLKARKKNAQMLSHVLKVKRRVRDGGSSGSGGGGSQIGDFTGRSQVSSEDTEHKDPRVCKGCMDRVSRWTRSYKCRKCNELICKSCATMTYLDTDTKQLRNRICAECSFGGNEDGDDDDDDESIDFELIDANDYATAQRFDRERDRAREPEKERAPGTGSSRGHRSKRDQEKEKEKERTMHRHKKRSDEPRSHSGEGRERTYSQLSVEEKPFASSEPTTTSPSDDGSSGDLGSTMTRLKQLNAAKQRQELAMATAIATAAATKHNPTVAPPALHRHHSGGTRSLRGTRNSRGLERHGSHDNLRVARDAPERQYSRQQSQPHPRQQHPQQRPASSKSRPPSRNMSSPNIRAEPAAASAAPPAAAMIDLSYLQSFAAAKPSVAAKTSAPTTHVRV